MAAFPDADTQLDLFHILRDIGRPVYRFKEHTFKELAEHYKRESAVSNEKRPLSKRAKERQKKLADYRTACDHAFYMQAMGIAEEVFRHLYRRLGVRKESEAYAELTRQAAALIPAGDLANVEKVHDEIIYSIKRASSMVENVNGRLRTYMNIKIKWLFLKHALPNNYIRNNNLFQYARTTIGIILKKIHLYPVIINTIRCHVLSSLTICSHFSI